MAEKLVIIILNSDPQNGAEILKPIYHTTIAASMDYHTEIILAGRAGELAIRGVADKIESPRKAGETLYDLTVVIFDIYPTILAYHQIPVLGFFRPIKSQNASGCAPY